MSSRLCVVFVNFDSSNFSLFQASFVRGPGSQICAFSFYQQSYWYLWLRLLSMYVSQGLKVEFGRFQINRQRTQQWDVVLTYCVGPTYKRNDHFPADKSWKNKLIMTWQHHSNPMVAAPSRQNYVGKCHFGSAMMSLLDSDFCNSWATLFQVTRI